jgi:hypothetical protein
MAAKLVEQMTNERALSKSRSEVGSRALKLLISGWSLLQADEHRRLDQKTVAAYCGLSETTLANWTAGATELTQLEALLKLLERLPEAGRRCLIDGLLRAYPTSDSPRFAHDPVATEGLQALLEQRWGVSFIQSASDFLRSIVLNALAYSATRIGSALRPVAGLDSHNEDSFVPVPGVIYLGHTADPKEQHKKIRAHWPLPQAGHLVFINGLWSALPEQLLACAEKRHVLVADDTRFDPVSLRQKLATIDIAARLLPVSELPGNRIAVGFAEV